MTVLGPVASTALGVTLPHEHLFLDLRNQFQAPVDPEQRRLSEQPVGPANLPLLRHNPYAVRDNLVLDDLELMVAEAGYFKNQGGTTIVDCTSVGIRRSPRELAALARRTGLNIVAGCGYYTHNTHPPGVRDWPAERIADEMIRDLLEGIGDTGVRAGIIGEIGTSDPLHPQEAKHLRAAARAFHQTNAAVYVHADPWGTTGRDAARVLLDDGVPPSKIVVCHIDVAFQLPYLRSLVDLGVFVEFDSFGKEFQIPVAGRAFARGPFARDAERVRVVQQVLDWGAARQVLLTTDICLKCLLHRYGGRGYDHLLQSVVPRLLAAGLDRATIDGFLVENPRRLLAG